MRNSIVLLIAATATLTAQSDPSGRVGRLSFLQGPVSLQPAGMTDWVDAEINRPLTTGDQIWVGDRGRAEIHVGSTAFRLDSNTALHLLNVDDQTLQIQVSQGRLTVRARYLDQSQNLELDTPNLAFAALRPGEYRITADPDSETTTVAVRSGHGEVTGGGQTFAVRARQQATVVGGDRITYNLVSAPGDDPWDRWNMERDKREESSQSARYVSPEVVGYQDLDQYGTWQSQPEYGQVWMPSNVAAGWAPYHDGHWAWIAPWGWTWVDDAPWGFAPYHYGRWASFRGRWGWIPGPRQVRPVYAPALVGWVGGAGGGPGFSMTFAFGTAAAVGWFALGPREPYFPSYGVSSGYFGRVNSSNTIIDNRTINNYYINSRKSNDRAAQNFKYANRNVQNAVVAVPQDRFASGHRVSEYSRPVAAPQLSQARYGGAPAIAPQRGSVLGPRAEQAARAPRPPAAVTSRPVVARTAPPPAVVPFERQQAELNKNPGRPVAPAAVQQMRAASPPRSAPVHVENMKTVQRVQPKVDGGPQQSAPPVVQQQPAAPQAQGPNNRQHERAAPPPQRPVAPQPNATQHQQIPQPPPDNHRQNDRVQPPPVRPEHQPPNSPPPTARPQRNEAPPSEHQQRQSPQQHPAQMERPKTGNPSSNPSSNQSSNNPPPQAKPPSPEKPVPEAKPRKEKEKQEKND